MSSAGRPSPAGSASCSRTTSTYAAASFWAPRRAVVKKGTIRTPGGGARANHAISADLPAQASARHQRQPRPVREKAASSANSLSRPTSSSGAMRRTCSQYAERTVGGGPVTTRFPSPITTMPESFSTPIPRFMPPCCQGIPARRT
ncbi:hypothetical protein [Streptomyces sp. NPDC093089]|uniref:hypothetical protein n=1 Tax=Streptomyces sp. NPDC093089 TaxID=3366024 RepID=UPI0038093FD6